MKVLILGATGRVGRLVTSLLLQKNIQVRALVRNPSALPNELATHCEIIQGDAGDVHSMKQAVDGVGAILYCLANKLFSPVNSLYSETTQSLLQAVGTKDIHIIWLTGWTGSIKHPIPWYQRIAFRMPPFHSIYADKFKAENLLRESKTSWTLVQSLLMKDGSGRYDFAHDLRMNRFVDLSYTRRGDVADFLVRCVLDAQLQNSHYVVVSR